MFPGDRPASDRKRTMSDRNGKTHTKPRHIATPTSGRFGNFLALKQWLLTLSLQICHICRHFDIQFLILPIAEYPANEPFCPANFFSEKLHPWLYLWAMTAFEFIGFSVLRRITIVFLVFLKYVKKMPHISTTLLYLLWRLHRDWLTIARAADSGGQEGQPPLLAKSRRAKLYICPSIWEILQIALVTFGSL